MTSLKQPPSFDPNGGDSYTNWKLDLNVWKLYTKEEKKKQGPAVYLCLQGDAREAVRSIEVAELAEDDGVEKIITALDAVFMKDETTRAFCAFKSFVEFRRDSGQSFSKFLLEFNGKYREVRKYKMELVDGVLAYFLLAAANLSPEHERLVRATATLTFDDMKDKLQKVFGELGDKGDDQVGTLPIKDEGCFYTKGFVQQGGANQRRGGFSQRGVFSPRGGLYQRGGGAQRGSYQRGGNYGGRGKFTRFQGNPVDGEGKVMRCHECESTKHFLTQCPHRKVEDVGEGKVMRCHECESTKHFVSQCPHRKVEDANMTVHLTLVAGTADDEQKVMLVDTLGKGILDSACTKTVAGRTWMEEYLSILKKEDRKDAEESSKASSSLFRFGDGKESKSERTMNIPVLICGKRTKVEVDVVDNDIPLLISKPTMTSLGMIVDFARHEAILNGRIFKLKCNSTGHYVIPVCEWTTEGCNVVLHLEHLAKLSKKEKEKKAMKLHRQFAHATKEKLLSLLKSGGCDDKELLQEIEKCCDSCSFCQKYRRQKLRPIVAFSKADRFNKVVSMDLKELTKGKLWILHLIDCATRYTAAVLIESKKKDIVVTQILRIWLAYFGAPCKFHSDCGGEFVNEVFKEMNEKFGIETSTTPGEAPFSNGTVERNNAMLYETMMKTMEDAKCSRETALAWAVCAKNALQNTFGYSPNQLVFGANVNLPSVAIDELPALESFVHSDLVRENLEALHRARENFVKAESSERIRRALKHNVRTYAEVEFSQGEKVYYKRRADKRWRGPAKVLGKESNFVLIRHGGTYYRCHPCQLIKVNEWENGARGKKTEQEVNEDLKTKE